MRAGFVTFALLLASAASCLSDVSGQSQPGPVFDVVSIKRIQGGPFVASRTIERPDGGITLPDVSAAILIARAYPPVVPVEIVGLPAWATSERYDLSATASLTKATADDRIAMLRAMLADRFRLSVHFEKREQPVFDLLVARSDGKLGKRMTPSDLDCDRILAERAAEAAARSGVVPPSQFPDPNTPPPPCTLRVMGSRPPAIGDKLEGEATMAALAQMLRMAAGRLVVDKTGLAGAYRVTMDFDMRATLRGPDVPVPVDAPPSVFTAIREQLGLKLEASKAMRDTLVIDRLERPSEN